MEGREFHPKLSGSSQRVLDAWGMNEQNGNFKVLSEVGLPCGF